MPRIGRVFGVALLVLAAAACSEDAVQDQVSDAAGAAVELGIRNAAAVAGAEAFEDQGIELVDGLECEATADVDAGTASVSCTGETTDGGAARVRGDVTGDEESGTQVRGSFVGTVDGKTVFEERCLGNGC
jgi:hypothetical protein